MDFWEIHKNLTKFQKLVLRKGKYINLFLKTFWQLIYFNVVAFALGFVCLVPDIKWS